MIINDIFENWNKDCYVAKLKETKIDENGNEINFYEKPNYYSFNIQPANGKTDIQIYGERVTKMLKAYISSEYLGEFKEGDKAYLEGKEPEGETSNTYGITANYKIISVEVQNTVILIRFERIA